MSVVERLEDACQLLDLGRHEGALNSVLTAISGASRQRYPKTPPRGPALSRKHPGKPMGDHEAFETFLEDQFKLLGAPPMKIRVDGKEITFSSAIYTLFRCALSHEGGLHSGGSLVPDPSRGRVHLKLTSLDPLGFEISYSTIVFLADLVARAPEHAQAASDVRARIMMRLPIHPDHI